MDKREIELIINLLGLKPHPQEGGYFAETYRCPKGTGERSLATAIYYLLTEDTISAMHRLPTDEIFHFYLGDPVTMLMLDGGMGGRTVTLGSDLFAGERPQIVVPGGVWQGSFVQPGGHFALMGTTMAPGFDASDYEAGVRACLIAEHPDWAILIERLTP